MQLVVEATGVADGVAILIATPQCRGACATVGAVCARSPRRRLCNKDDVIYSLPH